MFNKALPNALRQEHYIEAEPPVAEVPAMTLTLKQLARELNLSDKTARNLAHTPGFPSFRIGNRVLVNRKALQLWLDQQCDKPAA